MKRTFKVHKDTKTIRLTRDLIAEGFDGELEGLMNAVTLTLVKSGTSIDLAIESLEGTIRDLQLRKRAGQELGSKPPEKPKGFDEMKKKLGR